MSKKLHGSQRRIDELQESSRKGDIEVKGTKGRLGMVPITTEGIVQRKTSVNTILAYLEGGFDWSKFSPVDVCEFTESKREEALVDGDHRKHLFMLAFPDATEIPAWITPVADEKEYHRIFAAKNKHNRKNANPEETFLHDYLGGDADAILTGGHLIKCKVAVEGSPDDPVKGYVGPPDQPLVKVGGFAKAVEKHGIGNVKRAVSTIKLAGWGCTPDDRYIQVELLGAVALMYKMYPKLKAKSRRTRYPAEFESWFKDHLSNCDQKSMAKQWKRLGNDVHHFGVESTALGMLKDFITYKPKDGLKNKAVDLPRSTLSALFVSQKK
jgi:hypothetical protein